MLRCADADVILTTTDTTAFYTEVIRAAQYLGVVRVESLAAAHAVQAAKVMT